MNLTVASSPHIRGDFKTSRLMLDVVIALIPALAVGTWVLGVRALGVTAVSMASALAAEWLYARLTHGRNTLPDCSALVTGLLFALTLPASTPYFVVVLGSVFAIVVVKCLCGGLGQNIFNPALAARAFVMLLFPTTLTRYTVDGVSAATPLAELASGKTIDMLALAMGNTSGVIGSSTLGLIAGGIYLLLAHGITWEIPTATIGSTAIFLMIFGGHGIDPAYLLPQLLGGGLLMAAFFMATDPVTCPSTTKGQLLYGCVTGVLIGLFRVKGASADSTTYAVLLANMFSNIIDELFIPLPFAFRIPKDRKAAIPKPVIILLVITLVAGAALSGVYVLTADRIAENQERAAQAAFLEVVPGAVSFETDEAVQAAAEGSAYGSVTIQKALTGVDESGNVVGYAISVRNAQSFDGGLALVVGIQADGTLNGISFTELHETAGMGMKCGEPDFMNQFAGVNVASFTLNKGGASAEDDVIDSVNGASVTSGSVVDAVNAALDFFAANLK